MNINHSGANINIMCGSGGTNMNGADDQGENVIQQNNNFIFNHTAPINLNFYEEKKQGTRNEGEKEPKKVLTSGEAEILRQ